MKQTAEQAGIKPLFPVGPDVNWRNMDAEYIARVNHAYRNMSDKDKKTFSMTSGFRPDTREDAIKLGMDPRTSQESVYDRRHGREKGSWGPGGVHYSTTGKGAKPVSYGGRGSNHLRGSTADFTNSGALKGQLGFHGIDDDEPHVELGRHDYTYLSNEPRVGGDDTTASNPTATTDAAGRDYTDSPALVPLGLNRAKAVRTVIDKSQQNEIKARLDAKAKLNVAVDAPAKTKVEATGTGMFKNNVTVDRKVAMDEPHAGGMTAF